VLIVLPLRRDALLLQQHPPITFRAVQELESFSIAIEFNDLVLSGSTYGLYSKGCIASACDGNMLDATALIQSFTKHSRKAFIASQTLEQAHHSLLAVLEC
jgi:hypothetical protein